MSLITTPTTKQITPSHEQQQVIDYRKGHLQVIACAGAGKTEAISRRVAELIIGGVQPKEILAFTFTERAAASLKERILRRVSEKMGADILDRLSPMYVGTIHSYCFRLLQEHVPQYANYDVLDDHRQAGLLSREYKRLGLEQLGSGHWGVIHNFRRHADVIENELIDPAKLKGTPLGECYDEYCRMLQRYHFLTYGQLITRAVHALEDPKVYERVHGALKHLIVDEYQDINPAQEWLIELLAQAPVHLCVVGDDDQAIYQWRGSNVENILTFAERYGKAESRPLSTNRRSRPTIIDTANSFAKTISPRLLKKMQADRSAAGPEVHCWSAETATQEAVLIADAIEELIKRGYRYRDIAILLRSVRTSSPPIIEVFRKRKIPIRCAGRTGLFLQPEAQVLGKTYAWLADNEWKTERFGESEPVSLDDLLEEYETVFGLGSISVKKISSHLEEWYNKAHDDGEPANLIRDYYQLLRLLGVHEWDLANADDAARMGGLARFSQLLADFEHVTRRARWVEEGRKSTFRGGQDRGLWFYRRLFNYLQYYALDAYEDFEGEDSFDLNAVDILTIHQAKGLEWPVVFVPCLVQGRFPSKYAGSSQDWLLSSSAFDAATRRRYEGSETDERRLFYVAMTRAKDMLYLSRFQRKKNRFQPSPFLVQVAGNDPKLAARLPLPPQFTPDQNADEEKPSLAFSEIAAYESCPFSYRLGALLGFQPQLAAELGYGKSIHHVLRRLADYVRSHGKIPNATEVATLLQQEFYLPFAQQATFERLKQEAQQLIDRYLNKYSQDLFRVWETERPFELHLDKAIITGRADVILDRENGQINSMALVDYKTATDPKSDDIYAFQLAIYTTAGRGEGIDIKAAYLHDLARGDRVAVPVGGDQTIRVRDRANGLVEDIVSAKFHPKPERNKCGHCDVHLVCQHGPAR
ncbi:MAG: DEAD/DEAH box helicase [Anaerolineae bacterium]|nr:DEAD/DEAH box helicase [Anaerolineae bacterium]